MMVGIRVFRDREERLKALTLIDLAIDNKRRGGDRIKLTCGNIVTSAEIRNQTMIAQQKTNCLD